MRFLPRSLRHLVYLQVHAFRLLFRDSVALFWTFAFPVLVFLLLATTTGRFYPPAPDGRSGLLLVGSGVIGIAVMSGGLFGIGSFLVGTRQSGVLLRYRLLPVGVFTVICNVILRNCIATLLAVAGVLLALRFGFGVPLGARLIPFTAVLVVGIGGFSAFGVLLASFVRTTEASAAVCNLLFYVMLFVSGATIPRLLLPEWLNQATQHLPTTHLVDALGGVLYTATPLTALWPHLLYLALLGVGSTLGAARRFTWA